MRTGFILSSFRRVHVFLLLLHLSQRRMVLRASDIGIICQIFLYSADLTDVPGSDVTVEHHVSLYDCRFFDRRECCSRRFNFRQSSHSSLDSGVCVFWLLRLAAALGYTNVMSSSLASFCFSSKSFVTLLFRGFHRFC